MAESVWKILYFPSPEESEPAHYLQALPVQEQVRVIGHLELISDRPVAEWRGLKWLKIWEGKIWQLDGKQTRVAFCIDEDSLVVLHAFKKTKNKTAKKDIQRIHRQHEAYLEFKAQLEEEKDDS